MQDQGIVVLLTILGNHTDAGWSNFGNWSNAQAYAKYLGDNFIAPYGLDGIDIDDEYSKGTPTIRHWPWSPPPCATNRLSMAY